MTFLKIVLLVALSIISIAAFPEIDINEEWRQELVSKLEYDDKATWMIIPNDSGELQLAILGGSQPETKINPAQDIRFTVYTRTGTNSLLVGDLNSLRASGFSGARPTKILIHGFGGNGNSGVIVNIKNAYLAKGDYNVIGVNWGALCPSPWYATAVTNARPTGVYVGDLIRFLISSGGANRANIHIIGHSLGAHVAGFAGASVTPNIGKITGLDPAMPSYNGVNINSRLDPSDADCVEVIHTNGGGLGYLDPLADVDFYPNGGRRMPGCGLDLAGSCSHGKAVDYFVQSVRVRNAYPARRCTNLNAALNGNCQASSPTQYMGDDVNCGLPGIFHVTTD